MKSVSRKTAGLAAMLLLLALAACGKPQVTSGINDPFEQRNRGIHDENLVVDRVFLRDAARTYGKLPEPLRVTMSNLGQFMSLPRTIVNNLLQLRIEDAGHNSMRLLVNATFGLGGMLDPASEMGLGDRPSDFGITLAVWGVPEGAYVVHPFTGPSTERATFGTVIDRLIDPLTYLGLGPYAYVSVSAKVADALGDRDAFADTVDAILYDSADSYAQARLIYLENRRFEVAGRSSDDVYFDPYEDIYEDLDGQ